MPIGSGAYEGPSLYQRLRHLPLGQPSPMCSRGTAKGLEVAARIVRQLHRRSHAEDRRPLAPSETVPQRVDLLQNRVGPSLSQAQCGRHLCRSRYFPGQFVVPRVATCAPTKPKVNVESLAGQRHIPPRV